MKVSLLLCVGMLSAISAGGQCTHEPVGKPLHVRLVMENDTPIIIQNTFLNGFRSIPDVTVRTDTSSAGGEDVVVHVNGQEVKATDGNVMGSAWYFEVYRYWSCGGPPVPSLIELFDGGMQITSLPSVATAVQKMVAEINVKWFETQRLYLRNCGSSARSDGRVHF
jgi:hypothetical protein